MHCAHCHACARRRRTMLHCTHTHTVICMLKQTLLLYKEGRGLLPVPPLSVKGSGRAGVEMSCLSLMPPFCLLLHFLPALHLPPAPAGGVCRGAPCAGGRSEGSESSAHFTQKKEGGPHASSPARLHRTPSVRRGRGRHSLSLPLLCLSSLPLLSASPVPSPFCLQFCLSVRRRVPPLFCGGGGGASSLHDLPPHHTHSLACLQITLYVPLLWECSSAHSASPHSLFASHMPLYDSGVLCHTSAPCLTLPVKERRRRGRKKCIWRGGGKKCQ